MRRHGLPVAVHVAQRFAIWPHLVATLDARFLADLPPWLIGDRGDDSDALDETLMKTYGTEMIAHPPRPSSHHAGWPMPASCAATMED